MTPAAAPAASSSSPKNSSTPIPVSAGGIAVYGQECNHITFGPARMNLAIRGIFADIRWNPEGTLLKDAFPDERFDYILANPPFNIKDWSDELMQEDTRRAFGAPPVGNANFAWIPHIYSHLSASGVAGVVMANGSMSSMEGGEGDIRRLLVEGNAVDAMVALPGQLFYGTTIPACIWVLAKDRSNGIGRNRRLRDRRGEALFIDARKMGALVPGSRKQKEFSSEEITRIADTYHAWREGEAYADVPGFCKSASLDEIRAQTHVLTPGRYVGAEVSDEDNSPFLERCYDLRESLRDQFSRAEAMSAAIDAELDMIKVG